MIQQGRIIDVIGFYIGDFISIQDRPHAEGLKGCSDPMRKTEELADEPGLGPKDLYSIERAIAGRTKSRVLA